MSETIISEALHLYDGDKHPYRRRTSGWRGIYFYSL